MLLVFRTWYLQNTYPLKWHSPPLCSSILTCLQDLLYYKEPPRLQVLHVLRQSDQGGENLFSDSFRAAADLARKLISPLASASEAGASERKRTWEALTSFRLPFHYKNSGHWLEFAHPTIRISSRSMQSHGMEKQPSTASEIGRQLRAVRWSPPFQAPLPMPGDLFSQSAFHIPLVDYWLRGAKLLKKEFERKGAVYQTRMNEGTCVIFDNWRILHARRAFSGGERWLRGTYIDNHTFTQQVLRLGDSKI